MSIISSLESADLVRNNAGLRKLSQHLVDDAVQSLDLFGAANRDSSVLFVGPINSGFAAPGKDHVECDLFLTGKKRRKRLASSLAHCDTKAV